MKIPEGITAEQIVFALGQWVLGRNAERNREITKRRLIDGVKYETLEVEFGLTVRQLKNIVYKCESKIFKHLP